MDLGKQVRIYCAANRAEMSALIADALRLWLAQHPNG
jgi:hypothetical protein